MSYIQSQVKKHVDEDFKDVWKKSKKYFLITGCVLAGIVLFIGVMLIYRAVKQGNKDRNLKVLTKEAKG
jgi:hypothetical protein